MSAPDLSDDTVRVTPGGTVVPAARPGSRWGLWAGLAGVLVVGAVGGSVGWWLHGNVPVVMPAVPAAIVPTGIVPAATAIAPPAAVPAPAVVAPPPAPSPPAVTIATATETEILAAQPTSLTVFRYALNPHILVLDFPALHEQGRMLNRIAALVEKAGQPHDRLLDDAALDQAIRASGATPDTYYYGHDYRAADLARFFALADRDRVALTPEEETLRRLLRQEGLLAPEAVGAVISLPAQLPDQGLDPVARATILRHELSHGEYFTNPDYAAYTRLFWLQGLSGDDRAMFRKFLGGEGYDASLDDLMMNETQAYLMHTRDPRFFNAQALGTTAQHLAQLQAAFLLGMPPGWLRDCTPGPSASPVIPAAAVPAPHPVARTIPRRRHRPAEREAARDAQCFASVSSTRAAADSRVPRLRAASSAACSDRK